MLVLTRKIHQKIFIDNGNISVQIVSIDGNQVKIGIDAPKNISIDRQEIFEQKELERILNEGEYND